MPQFEFIPKQYPTQPGCYLMRDHQGLVLYVGKAKNLRRRLASYFRSHPKRGRISKLVKRITEIEVILLNNETESLILENNLIDRYRPPYNRLLWRADKGYPYIGLTREKFPRFVPYYKTYRNGAGGVPLQARFGPYLSLRFRDFVLDFVSNYFQLRTCQPLPNEVCLRFHIHRCTGICEGKVAETKYAENVASASEFLASARIAPLVHQMKGRMQAHAERLEFERAQWLKEQVALLESSLEKQVVERVVDYDQGVVYFGDQQALVANIKCGSLQEVALVPLDSRGTHETTCAEFLLSHYSQNSPREIIVNEIQDTGVVERKLAEMNGYTVDILVPIKGIEWDLVQLCRLNYDYRTACT